MPKDTARPPASQQQLQAGEKTKRARAKTLFGGDAQSAAIKLQVSTEERAITFEDERPFFEPSGTADPAHELFRLKHEFGRLRERSRAMKSQAKELSPEEHRLYWQTILAALRLYARAENFELGTIPREKLPVDMVLSLAEALGEVVEQQTVPATFARLLVPRGRGRPKRRGAGQQAKRTALLYLRCAKEGPLASSMTRVIARRSRTLGLENELAGAEGIVKELFDLPKNTLESWAKNDDQTTTEYWIARELQHRVLALSQDDWDHRLHAPDWLDAGSPGQWCSRIFGGGVVSDDLLAVCLQLDLELAAPQWKSHGEHNHELRAKDEGAADSNVAMTTPRRRAKPPQKRV